MGLLDRVSKAYMALMGKEQPKQSTDTHTNLKRAFRANFLWMQEVDDRKAVEEAIERMDNEDEIVTTALDAIADCATTFTDPAEDREFYVECDNTRAAEVIDELCNRVDLYNRLWDITRTTVEKGNHFCQNVIDDRGRIVAVKQFPFSYQIKKNVDEGGDLLTGDPREAMKRGKIGIAPYDQVIDQTLVAAFFDFQILHFMYGVTKGKQYAKPILRAAIRNWRRLQISEDSVALARVTRAYDHLVHKIPMPVESSLSERIEYIKRYKEMMTRRDVADYNSTNAYTAFDERPEPPDVETDYYIQRLFTPQGDIIDGDVSSVGGENPHITNLDDLDRALNRILCVLKVPAKYLNYDVGRRSFVDTGDKERDEQFGRVLRKVQKSVKRELYTLFDLQLALQGIDPDSVEYSIIMPPIAIRAEERVAQIENQRGQTATYWRTAGVPPPVIWDKVLGMSPEEIEAVQQMQLDRQAQFGLQPNDGGEDDGNAQDSQDNTIGQD